MRKPIVAVVATLMFSVLLGVMAHAQSPSPSPSPGPTTTASPPYPPQPPTCLADRSRAAPGDPVDITGDGWEPETTVDLDFHQSGPAVNRDLGDAQANTAGTFVKTVRIPEEAHGGPGTITLTGTDSSGADASCSISLTITGDAAGGACAQVSDDVVTRGQAIRVFSADGCWSPGTTVRIFFASDPVLIGVDEVDDDGSFSVEVRIPADATIGDHQIRVRGTDASGAAALRTVPIEVVAGAAGGGGLAGTGLALWGFLILAAALLAFGSSLLAAARAVPADVEHTAFRQEHRRRMVRAVLALSGGFAALGAWLVVAALHPGDAAGLSLAHPVSPGTVLLGLLAAWALFAASRPPEAS